MDNLSRESNENENENENKNDYELQKVIRELFFYKFAIDTHCIFTMTDNQGLITYANDKFLNISQYELDELIGQNHSIVNSGHHSKEFFAHLWSTIKSGQTWKGEVCNRSKDGTYYWVETTIFPHRGNGNKTQYVNVSTNITERKKYLDSLLATNKNLSAIERIQKEFIAGEEDRFKKILEIILERIESLSGFIIEVTHNAKNNIDFEILASSDGFDQNSIAQYITAQYINAQLNRTTEDGNNSFCIPLQHNNDIMGVIGLELPSLMSQADVLSQFPIVFETCSKILFEKKKEDKAKVIEKHFLQSQKMEAVGQLTGGIAHDFNNMLSVIIHAISASLKYIDKDNTAKAKETLSKVEKVAHGTTSMVKQLMMFSRADTIDTERIDLGETLTHIFDMTKHVIKKGVTINENFPLDQFYIDANKTALQQVVMNLMINARDAMNEKGEISASLKVKKIDKQYCQSCFKLANGEYLEISIKDNGPGIQPDKLEKIFTPFFTTKETGKGTGMGLAMVHGYIHEMDGHILVDSVVGKGTEFKLLIPVQK